MQIGMPTLIELPKIEDCVKLCKELGLQFVEINMNLPQYQIDQIDISKLNALRNSEGVFFTIHLDEKLDVSDFNQDVATAYQNTVRKAIEIAKKIEAPILNMHMAAGVYFTMPDCKIYLYEEYRAYYYEKIRRFRDMVDTMYEKELAICIENTDGYRSFQKKAIDYLLQSTAFALTYDAGHDACAGESDKEFIFHRISHLRHMHLHDADTKQCHLSLGKGTLCIDPILLLAQKANVSVVLETKTILALKESVQYLQRRSL